MYEQPERDCYGYERFARKRSILSLYTRSASLPREADQVVLVLDKYLLSSQRGIDDQIIMISSHIFGFIVYFSNEAKDVGI